MSALAKFEGWDLEDERVETLADLEAAFGPRTWDASLAEQAEPTDGDEGIAASRPDGMTLDEIAAVLGISRERVRQIEQKAMRKLRAAIVRANVGAAKEVAA